MTDIQFKAMVKICLTVAEATREVKEFKKFLRFAEGGPEGNFAALLTNMAESLNDMEKIRQVLKDIMLMEVDF